MNPRNSGSLGNSGKSDYPRDVAVRVLTGVLSDRKSLDEAIEATSGAVSPSARNWIQEVCSGTLRWKGRLDFILDSLALKKKPSGWLRKILLVSSYQLVVQEKTPPALVISETVSEIKKKEGEAPSKFANACLRKVAEHSEKWKSLEIQDAASAGLPSWFWDKLLKEKGLEWAREFARSSLDRPVIWLRTRGDWKYEGAERGPVSGSWKIERAGPIQNLPGFSQGRFIVQDISSQVLIAEVSKEVRERTHGARLNALDLCAAPGGKAVGLSWNGFQVHATDREEGRLALLKQTLTRVRSDVTVLPREVVKTVASQDLVWVDPSCTGTGILRRHPEVRWLRKESDLPALVKLQTTLVAEAWNYIKPGGFLMYSVCSVLGEEGPEIFKKAQSELEGLKKIREWALAPQISPFGDGFWAILVQKG